MTSAATSNIDFGERTKFAVTLFNAERFVECERELTGLLGYPELPLYYRIKCHIVRAECQENWHDAERELQTAENMWWNCRFIWPAETASTSTNWLLAKLRKMIDDLRSSLEEERPLGSEEHQAGSREDEAELVETNQKMLGEMAEPGIFEFEAGQEEVKDKSNEA